MHKVAVLHSAVPEDAPKDELDVIVQAQEISQALCSLGYLPVSLPFSLDLTMTKESLTDLAPLLVVNLVETVEGRGRFIHLAPTLLDALGIPFTGCGTEAVFLSSNKIIAKKLLAAHGVATPPAVVVGDEYGEVTEVNGRYIIKSVWEHASIGIDESSVVAASGIKGLVSEISRRQADLGGEAFAEAYIEGREFNIAILEGDAGPEVLPPAEILFDAYPPGKPHIVDYAAKWEERSFEFHHTPRSFEFPVEDAPRLRRLSEMALDCWRIFNLRGYARVDFRVDVTGTPWVLEINANPCLSSDGGFIAAATEAGLRIEDVVARLIRAAFGRGDEAPALKSSGLF
jgi:D-alanine-D-alanine ligase